MNKPNKVQNPKITNEKNCFYVQSTFVFYMKTYLNVHFNTPMFNITSVETVF